MPPFFFFFFPFEMNLEYLSGRKLSIYTCIQLVRRGNTLFVYLFILLLFYFLYLIMQC